MSGCYNCGSGDGTAVHLCVDCIQSNQARAAQFRSDFREKPANTDLIFVATQSLWLRALILGAVFCGAVATFFLISPFRAIEQDYFALMFALLGVLTAAATLTWICFFVGLLINDTMWAVATLIMPCLVYRYVWLRWEEAGMRWLFISHIAAVGSSFAVSVILSNDLGVSSAELMRLMVAVFDGAPDIMRRIKFGEY